MSFGLNHRPGPFPVKTEIDVGFPDQEIDDGQGNQHHGQTNHFIDRVLVEIPYDHLSAEGDDGDQNDQFDVNDILLKIGFNGFQQLKADDHNQDGTENAHQFVGIDQKVWRIDNFAAN